MPLSQKVDSYSSGELARLVGVSADTLRHYERKRVLSSPRRTANGYRRYPGDALQRVQLVRRVLDVGFTLDELAQILEARDRGGAHVGRCAQRLRLSSLRLKDSCRVSSSFAKSFAAF